MTLKTSSRSQSLQRLLSCSCLCLICLLAACQGKKDLSPSELDALTADGIGSLQTYSFDIAYKALSTAHAQSATTDPDYIKITYCLALAAWHKSPPSHDAIIEAKQHLRSVVEMSPDSKWAASALIDLGRIDEVADFNADETDVPSAQAYYKRVRNKFPNSEYSAKATLYLAQSMIQDFDKPSTEAAAQLLVEEMKAQPDSHWLSTMAQFTAQIYAFYLNNKEQALTYYNTAWERGFPRAAEADLSLWQYGLLAQECEQDLLAAKVFTEIVQKYPRSLYGTLARERVRQIAVKYPDAEIVVPTLNAVKVN